MTESALWRGKTLGILGGGNMAEALVRGALSAGLMPPGSIYVHDPVPARRQVFVDLGCHASENPSPARRQDALLLSVKPQNIDEAVMASADEVKPGALVISIAAGVGIDRLEAMLPAGVGVVRVMPNTPLLIGQGMSALAGGRSVSAEGMRMAMELFAVAGTTLDVDESMLDAVTALSGSGPAYLFRFAETLIDAGTELGLARDVAETLAIGMLRGSAEMLSQFRQPALLRERVTSPGGTTAAALKVLDDGDLSGLVRRALTAARDRSIELGRGE